MDFDAPKHVVAPQDEGRVRIDVWTFPGVPGSALTLLRAGDVILLHTADEDPVVYVDELMKRTSPGKPIEMTRQQLKETCEYILSRLEK